MDSLSDILIWSSLKKGDINAFSTLFKKFYPELHNYGLKISKQNYQLTEDCLQDFFLYLYNHRENLAELKVIKPYLYASFRRRLIKDIAKTRKFISYEIEENRFIDITYSIEELIVQQEIAVFKRETLLKHLNSLSNRQKEIIYLKYYNNLSISEIATVLEINYQSVVNTIHKAIKKLREESSLSNLLENIIK